MNTIYVSHFPNAPASAGDVCLMSSNTYWMLGKLMNGVVELSPFGRCTQNIEPSHRQTNPSDHLEYLKSSVRCHPKMLEPRGVLSDKMNSNLTYTLQTHHGPEVKSLTTPVKVAPQSSLNKSGLPQQPQSEVKALQI